MCFLFYVIAFYFYACSFFAPRPKCCRSLSVKLRVAWRRVAPAVVAAEEKRILRDFTAAQHDVSTLQALEIPPRLFFLYEFLLLRHYKLSATMN